MSSIHDMSWSKGMPGQGLFALAQCGRTVGRWDMGGGDGFLGGGDGLFGGGDG